MRTLVAIPSAVSAAVVNDVAMEKKSTVPVSAVSRIAAGSQPGDTIALSNRGLPRLDGRGKGSIVAHLKLVVPTALSPDEETHLRAYATAGGQRVNPERGSFFRRKKKK